jgi:hypothetical protein
VRVDTEEEIARRAGDPERTGAGGGNERARRGCNLRDDAIARQIDARQGAGGIGDHPDAGRAGGDAALAVADWGSDAGGYAVRRLIDSIDAPVSAARRPDAAEAGGKPATGALPHGDGRDDRVGVWIDARDVIHVAVGNPNGVGSDGHPVGRAA